MWVSNSRRRDWQDLSPNGDLTIKTPKQKGLFIPFSVTLTFWLREIYKSCQPTEVDA